MPVFCLFILGRHGNFTAMATMEQPDLLCTALALNIELFQEYYRVCRFIDFILEFRIDVCHLYKLLFQTQFLSNYPTIIIICITLFLKFTINASSMKMNLVTIC
jgi:hypothetical protein